VVNAEAGAEVEAEDEVVEVVDPRREDAGVPRPDDTGLVTTFAALDAVDPLYLGGAGAEATGAGNAGATTGALPAIAEPVMRAPEPPRVEGVRAGTAVGARLRWCPSGCLPQLLKHEPHILVPIVADL